MDKPADARTILASKTWHTVEFSRNRHTPPDPRSRAPIRTGATS